MAKKDRIALGPEMPCGHRPFIREHPDGSTSVGVGNLGRPDEAALENKGLHLKHDEGPFFEVVAEHHPEEGRSSGPAMVSSDAYRTGWEGIFGNKPVVGEA